MAYTLLLTIKRFKTNMVLSDLILGWSQLVTGHADSLIISYLKMIHVRFSL